MLQKLILKFCFVFFLIYISNIFAQSEIEQSFLQKNITFTGSSNIYGELYNVSGITNRRPPSTARLSLNPNLQIKNLLNISATILVSTEGTDTRQNMNILGLHPVWKWGKAHLGDFSDNLSKHSYSGVSIKGCEIDLFPSKIHFTLGGGRSREAVEGISVGESYAQYAGFTRIGYGNSNNSFLDIIALKVKDDTKSLKKNENWDYTYIIADTMENIEDTIWVEPPYNPFSVTPQENLVLGMNSRINLFKRKLVLEFEGTGSAFTKDLNSDKIKNNNIEANEMLKNIYSDIFTPRVGSAYDFAVNSSIKLNLEKVNFSLGFRHIGPGYISLGTPSNINDREELSFSSNMKLSIHRIRFGWNRMLNNLNNQKLQTNTRNQFNSSIYTALKKWRSQVNFRYLDMNNEADFDSLEWTYDNINFSTHQSIVFQNSILRQIGLQYVFQRTDKNTTTNDLESNYNTMNFTTGFRLKKTLNLNSSAGLSYRKNANRVGGWKQVYSLRLSHITLENKLTNAVFLTSNMVRETKMFRVGLISNYRLAEHYRITANINFNRFNGQQVYKELRSSIMLSHQF